jgi:hypothetical protein
MAGGLLFLFVQYFQEVLMFPGQRNVFVTQQKDKLLGIGAAGANACFLNKNSKQMENYAVLYT